jgi:hypothetical protein
MFTSNPVADAAVEMNRQDASEYQYDHRCTGCQHGFDSGHGVQISDEKFCNACIDEFKHFEFYREECGLSDHNIYEVTNKQIPL